MSSPGARTSRPAGCRHPASGIRRKLSALSSLFDYLCERNAVSGNPVDGVKRPMANGNEGSTPALGNAQARKLLEAPPANTLKGVRDRAMLHDPVVVVELADGGAELEQQAVGVVEIDRTAPFVIDHRRYVNALAGQVRAPRFEFIKRIAMERIVIEPGRQVLRAVDIGGPLARDSGNISPAEKHGAGGSQGWQTDEG